MAPMLNIGYILKQVNRYSLEKIMDKKIIIRYSIRESMGLIGMAVALFWSAGTLNWWSAWGALGVMFLWIIATATVILRTNPELLRERLGPRKGAKPWDMAIMSLLGLTQLARYIIAGLDQRFNWTGGFPFTIQIIVLILCALGYALVVWSTATNAYFSQIVRIQTERGQTVVSSGPYDFMRHPAYSGALLYELAASVLLASWWSLIPAGFSILLLITRTILEDRLLQNELTGYKDYSRKVRYRLLPGVW